MKKTSPFPENDVQRLRGVRYQILRNAGSEGHLSASLGERRVNYALQLAGDCEISHKTEK